MRSNRSSVTLPISLEDDLGNQWIFHEATKAGNLVLTEKGKRGTALLKAALSAFWTRTPRIDLLFQLVNGEKVKKNSTTQKTPIIQDPVIINHLKILPRTYKRQRVINAAKNNHLKKFDITLANLSSHIVPDHFTQGILKYIKEKGEMLNVENKIIEKLLEQFETYYKAPISWSVPNTSAVLCVVDGHLYEESSINALLVGNRAISPITRRPFTYPGWQLIEHPLHKLLLKKIRVAKLSKTKQINLREIVREAMPRLPIKYTKHTQEKEPLRNLINTTAFFFTVLEGIFICVNFDWKSSLFLMIPYCYAIYPSQKALVEEGIRWEKANPWDRLTEMQQGVLLIKCAVTAILYIFYFLRHFDLITERMDPLGIIAFSMCLIVKILKMWVGIHLFLTDKPWSSLRWHRQQDVTSAPTDIIMKIKIGFYRAMSLIAYASLVSTCIYLYYVEKGRYPDTVMPWYTDSFLSCVSSGTNFFTLFTQVTGLQIALRKSLFQEKSAHQDSQNSTLVRIAAGYAAVLGVGLLRYKAGHSITIIAIHMFSTLMSMFDYEAIKSIYPKASSPSTSRDQLFQLPSDTTQKDDNATDNKTLASETALPAYHGQVL